jgi:MoaA/NifB/PqqE/SkfB family radical SAM enzyme
MKKAGKKRLNYLNQGIQIPTFLIASIAHRCNLNCLGCYARATGICQDQTEKTPLTGAEWESLFHQAVDLGIPFCLLAGGEPFLRHDVLLAAAKTPQIIFPIFTNGTQFHNDTFTLLHEYPHLIPVISLEGDPKTTNMRRGLGVAEKIASACQRLKAERILFGISITVTTHNMDRVLSIDFQEGLYQSGARVVFLIEYVPLDQSEVDLAFTKDTRETLLINSAKLKTDFKKMAFLSFPGDEIHLGGCLAAGRGFFHINPFGDAEACPFAPYSDRSLRNQSLLDVLSSPFFHALRSDGLVGGDHDGGCALFEHDQEVKAILHSLTEQSQSNS